MKNWAFSFVIPADFSEGELFRIEKDSVPAISAVYQAGSLMIGSYFSVSETPLWLISPASPGDTVEYSFRPFRIEILVNGVIADENWQYGEPRFDFDDISKLCHERGFSLTEVTEKTEIEDVVGHFTNAMGWRPAENEFVGDCMPYSYNGRYHILYLKDRHHHGSKWGLRGSSMVTHFKCRSCELGYSSDGSTY